MASNPDYVIMLKSDRDALVTFLAGLQVIPAQTTEAPSKVEDKPAPKKAK